MKLSFMFSSIVKTIKYKNGSNEAVSTEFIFLKALSFRRLRRRQR